MRVASGEERRRVWLLIAQRWSWGEWWWRRCWYWWAMCFSLADWEGLRERDVGGREVCAVEKDAMEGVGEMGLGRRLILKMVRAGWEVDR